MNIVNEKARKDIERFLFEDGFDMSSVQFKYLTVAVERYIPGMTIDEIVEPLSKEYGIKSDAFKSGCGKFIKSSKTFQNATLKKYIAYVYAKVILK